MNKIRRFAALFTLVSYIAALGPLPLYAEGNSMLEDPAIQSASGWATPEEGGLIRLDGAWVEVPAGAVARRTKITIQALGKTETEDEGMSNVTAGARGYRFEPHGARFFIPVRVGLPYNPETAGSESALSNLYTYFYDEEGGRWERLSRQDINRETRTVVSETTHFTDMINATLKLPEGPLPIQFDPNSIKNLQAAEPSEGVAKVDASGPGPFGAASFSISLRLPPGRAGMTPNLAVRYSSEGGSGQAGRGFDIEQSSITTDTRFGAPRYDGNEVYLLDGQELVLTEENAGVQTYQPRVERAFQRIRRYIEENYWEVTDKTGTMREYGRNEGWTGPNRNSRDRIYTWYLTKVKDPFGNTMKYSYTPESYADGSSYTYLTEIHYTGNDEREGEPGADGAFGVSFAYEDREDCRQDGRGGFLSTLAKRLARVDFLFRGETVRSYGFEYAPNIFGQSLLTRLFESDGTGTEFYAYGFDYYELSEHKDESGNTLGYDAFDFRDGDEGRWGMGGADELSVSRTSSGGASLYVGVKVAFWLFGREYVLASFGISGGIGSSTTASEYSLADINGDGMPDAVRRTVDGLAAYLNTGEGFSNVMTPYSGIPSDAGLLDRESQISASLGASASFAALSGSVTRQYSRSASKTSFSDVNGDGYPDFLVAGDDRYYQGAGDSFARADWTAPATEPETEDAESEAQDAEYQKTYYIQEPLRTWKACRSGEVEIRQSGRLENSANASSDGVVLRTYRGSEEIGTIPLTPPDGEPKEETISSCPLSRGENLYFLLDVLDDERGDSVRWNIRIRYSKAAVFEDMADYGSLYSLPNSISGTDFPYGSEVRGLYTYNESTDTWTLRSGWRATADVDTCTAVALAGFAIPASLRKEAFLALLNECGTEQSIPITARNPVTGANEDLFVSERDLVLAGYTYTPESEIFRRNENAANYSDAYIGSLFSQLGEDAVRAVLGYPGFSTGSFIYPIPEDVGVYSHTAVASERTRSAEIVGDPQEGQNRPDALLVLDTVNPGREDEETISLSFEEDGSPEIHRTSASGTYVDAQAAPVVEGSPETGRMTVSYRYRGAERRIELLARSCALDRLSEDLYVRYVCPAALALAGEICSASNVESVGLDVRDTVVDAGSGEEARAREELFDRCFEPVLGEGFALRADAREDDYAALLLLLDDLYGEEDSWFDRLPDDAEGYCRVLLLSEEELSLLSEIYGRDLAGSFGSVSDESGTTYRYVRLDASVEEREALEAAMTIRRCDEGVFPYYEASGTERVLKDGSSISEISAAMESAELWVWTRSRHSIVYRTTDLYDVTEDELPEGASELAWTSSGTLSAEPGTESGAAIIPAFDEGGASVLEKQYVHVFDSSADCSVENLMEDADLEKDGILEEATREKNPFAGGTYGWYYGVWSGYYDFSESLLNETAGPVGEAVDREISTEEAENSTVTPPPYLTDMGPNRGENGAVFITEFGASRSPVADVAWVGPVSKYSRTDLDENLNTVEFTYYYAAVVDGDSLTPTRNGGNAYHSLSAKDGGEADTLAHIRSSQSRAWDVSGGIGALGIGVTGGRNWGNSWQYRGIMDMNGDRYPDLLFFSDSQDGAGTFRVTYGTGRGFGNTATLNAPLGYLGYSTNAAWVFGAAPGSSSSSSVSTCYDDKGKLVQAEPTDPKGSGGGGLSFSGFNGSFGHSYSETGFYDINGDGLPDQLARRGGSYTAAVNLGGTDLSGSRSWRGGLSMTVFSGFDRSTTDGLTTSSVGSFGTSIAASYGISTPVASSGASLNLGVSASVNRTHAGLYDVNGDGLPDEVAKNKNESFFRVRVNLGDHFSDEELRLYRPDWKYSPSEYLLGALSQDLETVFGSIGIDVAGVDLVKGSLPSGNDGNLFASVCDPFLVEDVLDYQTGVTYSFGASVSLSVNLGILQIVTVPGINMSFGRTSVTQRFMDIDGDGLPDHVLKMPGQDFFLVRRNIMGKVGLLKDVILPQGGRLEFEFRSVGNTPEMPQRRWVMSALTRNAGPLPEDRGASEYREEYDYAGGYYDRAERMFYGFETVTTTRADGSAITAEYHNRSYYLKGAARRRTVRDAGGLILSESLTETRARYLRGEGREAVYFPAAVSEEQRTYGADGESYAARLIEYEYDENGNVTILWDLGNPEMEADDLTARIEYATFPSADSYFRQHPRSIEVTDADGNLLRKREGDYGTRGELTDLYQYYIVTQRVHHELTWDDWGNLSSITDPRGSRVRWEYDDIARTYAVAVIQDNPILGGGSYTTRANWDYALGKPLSLTDANEQTISYAYDRFGRLAEIRSPYDTGAEPAVKYEYDTEAGAFPWTARTYNKILHDADDPQAMETVVAMDGLGRALQTAKQGEYRDSGGGRRYGWNLSGASAYDGLGRTIAEGQPQFSEEGGAPSLGVLTQATRKAYDALDRPVLTTLPDEATIQIDYTASPGALTEITTDPLGNISEKTSDVRGNILTVTRKNQSGATLTQASYKYDALGQMEQALDARGAAITVEYDLLGRRLSLESADSGRIEFAYDESGNVSRKTDSVLRSRGEAIKYEYDGLNRILTIDYPRTKDTTYEYGWNDAEARNANAAGRLLRREDASGTTEYTYGSLGETATQTRTIDRLKPLAEDGQAQFRYQWDYLGRLRSVVYPDGEEVSYGYDTGGQIKTVTSEHFGVSTTYVADIAYDAFGQRTYVEYGNGVRTRYAYDEKRRWLDAIHTQNGSEELQNIEYRFDLVGNVEGYTNTSGGYTTEQTYTYDGLYQLTSANGRTVNREYGLEDYTSTYSQTFAFDEVGNLTKKTSESKVNSGESIGDNLNYNLSYTYYAGKNHQAEIIGNIYYQYDTNGNVTEARKGSHGTGTAPSGELYREGDVRYTDYGFGIVRHEGESGSGVWARYYTWDEENRLTKSVEGDLTVQYRYGADGQRAIKHTANSETMYFDSMWQATENSVGFLQSKHIYVGQTRIATRLNVKDRETAAYEKENTYYYHPDHVGSAQLVTDPEGEEYERIEYTPYGELWVEKKAAGLNHTPFRFTGKELDEETGLYYYGARYLDPKTSRWISADPALGEYIPVAPVDDDARKHNQNLPGMGGVYNLVNTHQYHYAGNNPVKYTDPDGRHMPDEKEIKPAVEIFIYRYSDSYNEKGDAANPDKKGQDLAVIFNNETGEIVTVNVQTLANMSKKKNGKEVSAFLDSLAGGDFSLRLDPDGQSKTLKYKTGLLTIVGGNTLAGETIRSDGTTATNGIPWRGHDTDFWGTLGCLVGKRGNVSGDIKTLWDTLQRWGMKPGDIVQGHLFDLSVKRRGER